MSFSGNLRITPETAIRVVYDETMQATPIVVVGEVSIGFETQGELDRFVSEIAKVARKCAEVRGAS